MIAKSIIFSMLLQISLQSCKTGCLRCNPNNECLLCDYSNGYLMNESLACEQIALLNCDVGFYKNSCVFCSEGYYLDLSTKSCLIIPSGKAQTNCVYHTTSLSCFICKSGFYTSNGKCVAVTTKVDNCLIYRTKDECFACMKTFSKSTIEPNKCIPESTTVENCLVYSSVTCKKCEDGKWLSLELNPSYLNSEDYLQRVFMYSNSVSWLLDTMIEETKRKDFCFDKVYGCDPAKNELCLGCSQGQFLENGICKPNPFPRIDNCEVYSNLSTCSRCANLFFLKDSNCSPVVPVAECEKYDGSHSSTKCVLCKPNFFLSSGTCAARVLKEVDGCLRFDPESDKCAECVLGKTLKTQKNACLPSINFCENYVQTLETSTVHSCSSCWPGYYISTQNSQNICIKGTVANCRLYHSSKTNECSLCNNSFYLEEKVCKKHIWLSNCKEYHDVKPHFCNECQPGFVRLEIRNVCVERNRIPNCKTHSPDSLSCLECNPRFYRHSSGICNIIPQSLGNCLTSNNEGATCIKCSEKQILFQYKSYQTCLQAPEFLTIYGTMGEKLSTTPWIPTADSINSDDNICSQNAYPVLLNPNDLICVNNFELGYINRFRTVLNCKSYQWNPSQQFIFCSVCNTGYFISEFNDSNGLTGELRCVETCDTFLNFYVLNDRLGILNMCVQRSSISSTDSIFDHEKCILAGRTLAGDKGAKWEAKALAKSLRCLAFDGETTLNLFDAQNYAHFEVFKLIADENRFNPKVEFFGYHFLDRSIKPSALNYAGVYFSGVNKSQIKNTALLNNCNVFFWMKGGSAYAASSRRVDITEINPDLKDYGCLQCQFGYTLKYENVIADKYLYIPTCVSRPSTFCNKSIIRGGLPAYLNAALSCHSCGSGNVPRIKLEVRWPRAFSSANAVLDQNTANTSGEILQYFIPSTLANGELPFDCTSPTPSVFLFNPESPGTQKAFLNCGVFGELSRVHNLRENPAEVAHFCLACNHGYKPEYFKENAATPIANTVSIPNYIVISCQAASNCDLTSLQTPFNSCGKCLASNVGSATLPFFAYSNDYLRDCVPTKAQDCFIVHSSQLCSVCKSGFILNDEGYCETITLPNMEIGARFYSSYNTNKVRTDYLSLASLGIEGPSNQNSFIAMRFKEATQARIHFLNNFDHLFNGLSECKTGSSIVPPPKFMKRICALSSFLDKVSTIVPVYFIPDCQNYFHTISQTATSFKCAKCVSSKIPNEDNTKCHNQIVNCEKVLKADSSKCSLCKKEFSNINGVCKIGEIKNCKKYLPIETYSATTEISCSECEDYHQLVNGPIVCQHLPDLNCKKYSSNTNNCIECRPGYLLISSKPFEKNPATWHCLKIQGLMDQCNKFQIDEGVDNKVLKCTECNSSTLTLGVNDIETLPNIGNPSSSCLQYAFINNCIKYELNDKFSTSNMVCLKCKPEFYSDHKSCILRKVLFEECTVYNDLGDNCLSCKEGLVLTNVSPFCVPPPSGIPKCSTYIDSKTCKECEIAYYLKDGVCKLSEVVDNCLRYSDNKVCSVCANTYILNASKVCVKITATNCATASSPTACATCPTGKGLKTETIDTVQFTNCVDNLIENCFEASTVFPFKCLVCKTNFFLSTDKCTAVDPLIAGCLFYESATICSQCNQGFFLSTDKKKCINTSPIDKLVAPSCSRHEVLTSPVCITCKPGFELVKSACVSIERKDPLCFVYDDKKLKCLVCTPKTSYMNSNGQCLPNTISPTVPVVVKPSSAVLKKVILFFLALWITQLGN